MPTNVSAPLPELTWPAQTVVSVDAGDVNAVVESLVVLVSEEAASVLGEGGGASRDDIIPLYVYAEPSA